LKLWRGFEYDIWIAAWGAPNAGGR
jgi:hypothetical protein